MLTIGVRGAAGVVQVGDAVAETGAEVEQRGRRLVGHPRVAVGRAGDDALEQPEHRAHPGTVSSAATKCISDVPGFAKQTSTPESTSVRIRAWAPFMAGLPSRRWCRGSGSRRVERDLDAAHEVDLHRVLELQVVPLLGLADPVLARDRPPERHPDLEQLAHHPVAHLGIGLEDREVDVAVAGVPAVPRSRTGSPSRARSPSP